MRYLGFVSTPSENPSPDLFQTGRRFRAWPDEVLREVLPRWIGCQRFIYNGKVAEDRLFAAMRRMALRTAPDEAIHTPLDQQYSQFKSRELSPWLFEVPSQILRNAAYRWRGAKTRQLRGLAKAPRIRNRTNFDSVMITKELFRFVRVTDPVSGEVRDEIEIGTAAKPIGRIRFKATQAWLVPNSIVVRRVASGKWFVSFAFEEMLEQPLRTTAELAYELNRLDDAALAEATLALDRNVRDNCLADNTGRQFDLKAIERERLARKEIGRQRHQRALARKQKGSSNRRKCARKIACNHEYAANVWRNFAHQTSHQLASDDAFRLYALENLKVASMVRRPKAKQDPQTGRWLRNGAAAKAGLNKSILASAWGRTKDFLSYKAQRRGKLVVTVPPQYSSQECAACGHIHPGNRNKDRFVCHRCGFEAHADHNAAQVLKKRAITLLRSGELEQAPKPRKRVKFTKNPREVATERNKQPHEVAAECVEQLGCDTSEACSDARPMSVEPGVRRLLASNTPADAAGESGASVPEAPDPQRAIDEGAAIKRSQKQKLLKARKGDSPNANPASNGKPAS